MLFHNPGYMLACDLPLTHCPSLSKYFSTCFTAHFDTISTRKPSLTLLKVQLWVLPTPFLERLDVLSPHSLQSAVLRELPPEALRAYWIPDHTLFALHLQNPTFPNNKCLLKWVEREACCSWCQIGLRVHITSTSSWLNALCVLCSYNHNFSICKMKIIL